MNAFLNSNSSMVGNGGWSQNSIVSGIIWGTVFSTFTGMITQYIQSLISFFKSLFVASVSISTNVEYYEFLFEFFSRQLILSSTKINVDRGNRTNDVLSLMYGTYDRRYEEKKTTREENFSLGETGTQIIYYKGRILFVSKGHGAVTGLGGSGVVIDVPFGSSDYIMNLVEDIKKMYKNENNNLKIKTCRNGVWTTKYREKRRMETVILSKDIKDEVVKDIQWFLNNRDWYKKKDIHYHRGYIFTGSPGTGKSSLVLAIASQLNLPVYNFPAEYLAGSPTFLDSIEQKSIVLIEDIDRLNSLVEDKEKLENEDDETKKSDNFKQMLKTLASNERNNENAFRNLLQIMDGLISPEGVIFVLTANNPEKINKALLRSGRIDRRFHFRYADSWQAKQMFLRFFENEKDMANKFEQEYRKYYPDNVSASQLQERLIEAVKEENPNKIFCKFEYEKDFDELPKENPSSDASFNTEFLNTIRNSLHPM